MRLGLWSFAASLAVAIAVWVGTTDAGLTRLMQSLASLQGVSPSREVPSRESNQITAEMQRLASSVREINVDQNRLFERLEAIEKNLGDLTSRVQVSIQPVETAPITTATITTPVVSSAGGASPTSGSNPPQVALPAVALPQDAASAQAPGASKIEFGVDLGSAPTIEGLRTLWTSMKGRHGTLLDGLRPLITVREKARPSSIELRLVVGPLANPAAAARLCAAIAAAGAVCQPAVFDGQRLALR
jgi:hypothetical protein